MTVWSYAVVKLLFFDVDLWLAHRLVPGHVWLVQYRWLLAIVALTVFAIALRGPRLLGWTVYILFFPLILFFFHIPWALFKREAWTPAIVLVAAAVSVFKSFRWKLSFLSALLVGSFLVAASRKPALDLLGAALLIVVILLAYGWTVVRAFRSPPRIFSTEGLDKVWSFIRMPFELPKELKGSDPDAMTEAERSKWVSSLELTILENRFSYFIGSKLRVLKQKRLGAAASALRVLGLFVLTVWVFALLNTTLHRVVPGSFQTASHTTYLFDFIWYSFNSMFRASVVQVMPVSVGARVLAMLATAFAAVLLFAIVMYLLAVVQEARESEAMGEVLEALQSRARTCEDLVAEQFGMSIAQALERLVKVQSGFVSLILRLSIDLPHDTRDERGQL